MTDAMDGERTTTAYDLSNLGEAHRVLFEAAADIQLLITDVIISPR